MLTRCSPDAFFNVLQQADQDCGFPGVRAQVTYPPSGTINLPTYPPIVNETIPPDYIPEVNYGPPYGILPYCDFNGTGTSTVERLEFIINGTGPSCFGQCAIADAANNFYYNTDPALSRKFQSYNVDEVGSTHLYFDANFTNYLNRTDVKTAIHAPSNVTWESCSFLVRWGMKQSLLDTAPPSYDVVPTLLSNGVKVNIFSGKLDFLLPHLGSELVIQNMTWNGQQGFSNPPTVPLLDQYGQQVGNGREERNLTYYAFDNAGHRVAQDAPAAALSWLKNVVVKCDDDWWWWRSKRA